MKHKDLLDEYFKAQILENNGLLEEAMLLYADVIKQTHKREVNFISFEAKLR